MKAGAIMTLETNDYLGKGGVTAKYQMQAQLRYNEFLLKVKPELTRLREVRIDLQSFAIQLKNLKTL